MKNQQHDPMSQIKQLVLSDLVSDSNQMMARFERLFHEKISFTCDTMRREIGLLQTVLKNQHLLADKQIEQHENIEKQRTADMQAMLDKLKTRIANSIQKSKNSFQVDLDNLASTMKKTVDSALNEAQKNLETLAEQTTQSSASLKKILVHPHLLTSFSGLIQEDMENQIQSSSGRQPSGTQPPSLKKNS